MKKQNTGVSRRTFVASLIGVAAVSASATGAAVSHILSRDPIRVAVDLAAPKKGFQTQVVFKDSIKRLVEAGVISTEKMKKLYEIRGQAPDWVWATMEGTNEEPIMLSAATAPYLLNLLWALGLANKAPFNEGGPITPENVDNFASTGGWILGEAERGGGYFNSVEAVSMTEEQAGLVGEMADRIYRPCCNNSALFQDCNHGSAMLGLLQLAASQGIALAELEQIALAVNGYWYPDQYAMIALYLNEVDGRGWAKADPMWILGRDASSASGYHGNIVPRVAAADILPPLGGVGGGGGCSV